MTGLTLAQQRKQTRMIKLLTAKASKLRIALEAVKADHAEIQSTFDHLYASDIRGIKLWQSKNPGNDLVWPDRGKLVEWLLDELTKAKARIADYENCESWQVTCTSCARAWDTNYDLYCREQQQLVIGRLVAIVADRALRQAAMWKANHDNQVAIKRALGVRADLPAHDGVRQLLAAETIRADDAVRERDEAIAGKGGYALAVLEHRDAAIRERDAIAVELAEERAKKAPPKPLDDETFKVGRYELTFNWRNVDEYRNREKRAKSTAQMGGLTATTISLINRAYAHRGRMMLRLLPFETWRTYVKLGKSLRRGREA